MDRHRQEWLDYACVDEVLLDIRNEYLLIWHFWSSFIYTLCCIWAEQRCNLWRLLQGWQLHWFLHHTRDGGRDLFDSSTKTLRQWRWGWATFCVKYITICFVAQQTNILLWNKSGNVCCLSSFRWDKTSYFYNWHRWVDNCKIHYGFTLWRDFIIIFNTGEKTDSSTKSDGLANTAVIAGMAAALVLLLALMLVALYINYHPAAASSLYLIQVSAECDLHLSRQDTSVI